MTPEQLKRKVKVDGNGCWIWQRHIAADGYGKTTFQGKNGRPAHRVSYQVLVGPIPDGLTIDHTCRVRACVNPAHLEPVTQAENLARALPFRTGSNRHPGPSECINGHEFTPENTYLRPPTKKGGKRQCRACQREAVRRYKERKAA